MRAETLAGYERHGNGDEHAYPFCLIELIAETTDGSENRVAAYVEAVVTTTNHVSLSSHLHQKRHGLRESSS